jgi:hypothetical protein
MSTPLRLDRVSTMYPNTRTYPLDGENERLAAVAEADLSTNLKINASLGDKAAFEAAHPLELAALLRAALTGLVRPKFTTRVLVCPYGDALSTPWQPPVGTGWVLEGITTISGLDGAAAPITNGYILLEGLDEIRSLALPLAHTTDHYSLHFHVSGTLQINARTVTVGTAPTGVTQSPIAVLQFENWNTGTPLPE